MNRFRLSIASLTVGALVVFAGDASAQLPPPPPSSPNGNILQAALYGPGPVASPYAVPVYGMAPPAPDEANGNRYGLHPVLKRLFHIKSDSCGGGGCGDGAGGKFGKHKGPPAPTPMYNNPAQGGTLAFPQHPYVRGPRDFFLNDPR
jgi:hypothetical protein